MKERNRHTYMNDRNRHTCFHSGSRESTVVISCLGILGRARTALTGGERSDNTCSTTSTSTLSCFAASCNFSASIFSLSFRDLSNSGIEKRVNDENTYIEVNDEICTGKGGGGKWGGINDENMYIGVNDENM